MKWVQILKFFLRMKFFDLNTKVDPKINESTTTFKESKKRFKSKY